MVEHVHKTVSLIVLYSLQMLWVTTKWHDNRECISWLYKYATSLHYELCINARVNASTNIDKVWMET
jgi:hypothetical protein